MAPSKRIQVRKAGRTAVLELGLWYAVQVKPFYEHISEKILVGKGYQTFLPTYLRAASRHVGGYELALFPGYLFCRFMSVTSEKVVTTPGVIRVVGVGKTPLPVEDQEIEAIRAVIQSGLPSQPWRTLSEGSRLRIESGPLRSVEGILALSGASRRLVVTITLLQRSVAVELDPCTIVSIVQRMPAQPLSPSTPSKQRSRPSYV